MSVKDTSRCHTKMKSAHQPSQAFFWYDTDYKSYSVKSTVWSYFCTTQLICITTPREVIKCLSGERINLLLLHGSLTGPNWLNQCINKGLSIIIINFKYDNFYRKREGNKIWIFSSALYFQCVCKSHFIHRARNNGLLVTGALWASIHVWLSLYYCRHFLQSPTSSSYLER